MTEYPKSNNLTAHGHQRHYEIVLRTQALRVPGCSVLSQESVVPYLTVVVMMI